jgi:hypothetical protein
MQKEIAMRTHTQLRKFFVRTLIALTPDRPGASDKCRSADRKSVVPVYLAEHDFILTNGAAA